MRKFFFLMSLWLGWAAYAAPSEVKGDFELDYPFEIQAKVTPLLEGDTKSLSIDLTGAFPNGVDGMFKIARRAGEDEINVLVFADSNMTDVVTEFKTDLVVDHLSPSKKYR